MKAHQLADLMYCTNDVRLCDAKQVVVALERAWMVLELCPTEVLLLKSLLLDHGSHATVEDHDPLFQGGTDGFCYC